MLFPYFRMPNHYKVIIEKTWKNIEILKTIHLLQFQPYLDHIQGFGGWSRPWLPETTGDVPCGGGN